MLIGLLSGNNSFRFLNRVNELSLEDLEEFTKIKNNILCKEKYCKEKLGIIYNKLRGNNERVGSNL